MRRQRGEHSSRASDAVKQPVDVRVDGRDNCGGLGSDSGSVPAAARAVNTSGWFSTSSKGAAGDNVTAASTGILGKLSSKATDGADCVTRATAIACIGQDKKSASGNSDNPCSSDILDEDEVDEEHSGCVEILLADQ